jgi:hypothetical protein
VLAILDFGVMIKVAIVAFVGGLAFWSLCVSNDEQTRASRLNVFPNPISFVLGQLVFAATRGKLQTHTSASIPPHTRLGQASRTFVMLCRYLRYV